MIGICEICGKDMELTFHHFIPSTLHTNKKFKKLYETEFMKTSGIDVCQGCHSTIHKFFTEKELGNYFNTKSKLLENRKFREYVTWAKKH